MQNRGNRFAIFIVLERHLRFIAPRNLRKPNKISIFRISRGSYVPRGAARHENGQMPNGKVGHDDEDDLIFQFG